MEEWVRQEYRREKMVFVEEGQKGNTDELRSYLKSGEKACSEDTNRTDTV